MNQGRAGNFESLITDLSLGETHLLLIPADVVWSTFLLTSPSNLGTKLKCNIWFCYQFSWERHLLFLIRHLPQYYHCSVNHPQLCRSPGHCSSSCPATAHPKGQEWEWRTNSFLIVLRLLQFPDLFIWVKLAKWNKCEKFKICSSYTTCVSTC